MESCSDLNETDPALKDSIFDWRTIHRCIVELVYLMASAQLNNCIITDVRLVNTSQSTPPATGTVALAATCRILGQDQNSARDMLGLLKEVVRRIRCLCENARNTNAAAN